jgi:uncharacterized delta-60 repeat protein
MAIYPTKPPLPVAASKAALILFSFAMLLAGGVAALHGQSALDGFDPNANGTVYAVVVQPDGKIVIGGDFTTLSPNGGATVARPYLARLNPDGTLDPAFSPNANSIVRSIVLQADGKILVGGDFAGAGSIGGQARNFIARLDATTGLADSFDPNGNNRVFSMVVQADGKILAGGAFTTMGGQTRNRIARLDATTGVVDSFDPNVNDAVAAIAVQANGKILVGGDFSDVGGQTRNHIARLNPATGLADSFDPNANNGVFAIAVQLDGKILAGGSFRGTNSIGGQTRNCIARLDPATGLADSFDPNASGAVFAITIGADGKILVGGLFPGIGGQSRVAIARIDASTGAADSFNANANGPVNSIALQADGKILAGGFFTSMGGQPRSDIARLEIDGRLDRTLNLNTVGLYVFATAVQPDGKVLIGGQFTNVLGMTRKNIARLNADGTLDIAFDPNANGDVRSIAVQADGKILAAGFFNGAASIGGQMRNYIARLDATTGLADAFDPNPNNDIAAIAVQADGKILAGGIFTSIGGQTRNHIARLDAATGLADSFDPNANNQIEAIAVQADGKILAAGSFTSIGGQTRNHIARLDAATGLADSFDPNADGNIRSIAVQTDGKILAGGNFSNIGGQTRSHIARVDGTTGLSDSFEPDPDDTVLSIAVQADGKVLVGGLFVIIGGQMRNRIARLDATTGLSDSFDPDANDAITSIAVLADGKILACGSFTTIGGQPRSIFARLANGTAALQNLAVTPTTVTWTRRGSSPQFTRVTFEYSTDHVTYTPLGNGRAGGSSWTLTGLTLPTEQNIYIRARGYYRTGFVNASQSITESVRNAFMFPQPAQALNLATRLRVLTGDNVGIGGFIITGTVPKRVVVRGIGPSLAASGVPNPLADPVLELHGQDGFATITNNNWRDTQEAAIQAAGLAPTNNLESVIDATLAPGGYTAILRGNGNTSGGGLIEAFDMDPTPASKLGNISTRAFVGTGDDVVIAGVILGNGGAPARIVVRGIGPSLASVGVPNPLGNPTLELRNQAGTVVSSNNDWQDDSTQATQIAAAGFAPSNSLESAIIATLPPGRYTALLAGMSNGTGNGLVEIYDVN